MKSSKHVSAGIPSNKVVASYDLAFGHSVPALGGGPNDPIERKLMGNYQKVAIRDKVDESKPSILGPVRPVLQ
jgi:hypothetical protein